MWLLDVNVPKRLVGVLGEFGIEAHSAESRGWDDLTNGALERFSQVGVVLVTLP